jgi:glycosyltransferase involved in cell wall biosynthesis
LRVRLRRWIQGGQVIDGVLDAVPLTLIPWQLARIIPATMAAYSRWMLVSPSCGVDSLGLREAEHLIVDEPRFVGLARKRSWQTLTYRATDLYALIRGDPTIVDAEKSLCARADLLVATSEPVADHLRTISKREVHVITNGVEYEHFSRPSVEYEPRFKLPGIRGDRAVYVGAFDKRFDRDALREAALMLPRKQFILCGPGGRSVAAALDKSNVTALGAVPYAELPQLLSECAVGLLPLSAEPSNSGRSPMKLFEYAAAGLAVAATATTALRLQILPTLRLTDANCSFAGAVSEAFERAADAKLVNASREIANSECWTRKAQHLLDLVTKAHPMDSSAYRPG